MYIKKNSQMKEAEEAKYRCANMLEEYFERDHMAEKCIHSNNSLDIGEATQVEIFNVKISNEKLSTFLFPSDNVKNSLSCP